LSAANEPEHEALALLTPDLAPNGPLAELLIDRGYFGSPDIGALHARGIAIRAKAWTSPELDDHAMGYRVWCDRPASGNAFAPR
jgi:hypothetical protein